MNDTTTTAAVDTHDDSKGHGLSDSGYVKVALALAVITGIEVAISYIDIGPLFIPLLMVLMIIKFFTVVMVFMHLKFDKTIYSLMFYLGLGVAVGVYVVTLATFHFFN